MIHPKLSAVITMLILVSLGGRAGAQGDIERLETLERLVRSRDCQALYDYLAANPALMEGNDALSAELKVFVQAAQSGDLDCFSIAVPETQGDGRDTPSIY